MPRLQPLPRPPALGPAFWGAGVGGGLALAIGIAFVLDRIETAELGLLLAGFAVYTAWTLQRIWRAAACAPTPALGLVARALCVAWALNVVLVSAFLLLGRLGPG